ncbi:MAG: FeoB-associated Cys-rich membrane protein [Bacteroides sp.]|nr:FeoB-associated Cys-rich membrane protein [Bacteroides sp.]
MSPQIQFIVVIIILAGVAGWVIWKIFFRKGKDTSCCCGCSLSENCNKKEIKPNSKSCDSKK